MTAGNQPSSSGSEGPLGWNDPDLPPPVKRGNQREYVLAVYRESSKKIYSFACSYLNALPLQYEDACPKGAGCEGRGCDDGCPTTGWFWLTGEGDEAGTYQSLDMKPGDRIMGWRDLPQWGDAAQSSGEPVAWLYDMAHYIKPSDENPFRDWKRVVTIDPPPAIPKDGVRNVVPLGPREPFNEILKHVRAPNRLASERLDRIEAICVAALAALSTDQRCPECEANGLCARHAVSSTQRGTP